VVVACCCSLDAALLASECAVTPPGVSVRLNPGGARASLCRRELGAAKTGVHINYQSELRALLAPHGPLATTGSIR
jgi:hypothetical protein